MRRTNWWIFLLAALVFGPACDCSDPAGGGAGGGSGTGGGAGGGSGTGGGAGGGSGTGGGAGGGSGVCVPSLCPGDTEPRECGNCIDDDDDGAIDTGSDPDCLGPCHDNEAGYDPDLTGSPGNSCAVECYYDSNSGRNLCNWNWHCDPLEPRVYDDQTCEYDATPPSGGSTCAQLEAGLDEPGECETCMQLTPPGCDCFGCCELPAGTDNFVFIGTRTAVGVETCTYDAVVDEYGNPPADDSTRLCQQCTPTANCYRECPDDPNDCVLCLGETDLPAHCTPTPDGGTPLACEGGPTCAPISDNACPDNTFCFFGCCEPLIVPL